MGRFLLLLPAVILLTSCDSGPSSPAKEEDLAEQASPVHDIRFMASEVWALSDEPLALICQPEVRTGWLPSWRVGGGEILGDPHAAEITWRTPADTLSWVELTLSRGAEFYLCRRWTSLRRLPLAVHLHFEQGEPGALIVDSSLDASPRSPPLLQFQWGVDEGGLVGDQQARQVSWDARAAGPHRIWLQVDSGYEQAVDTLTVDIPNRGPEFGPGSGDLLDEWPCGGVAVLVFKGADANWDSLALDLLSLDGLQLEGLAGHAVDGIDEWQFAWDLTLREAGLGAGIRSIGLRLSDGLTTREQLFQFWFDCP